MALEDVVKSALEAYEQRNLPLVCGLCDEILESGSRPPLVLYLLGMVSMHMQQYWRAAALFGELQGLTPGDPNVNQSLQGAETALRAQPGAQPDGRRRCLIIKAWGYGFCSDLDHVLGGLLLAELTGRTPMVHWGTGSLFRDEPEDNAWVSFFEPVSEVSLDDVLEKEYSYFPPKWRDQNLRDAAVNKFEGDCSRMGGVLFFGQREDIAVSDLHIGVPELVPWIPPSSPLAGKTVEQVYRALVQKYLRLKPEIQAQVDEFARTNFSGRTMLGVHARGSDKLVEDEELGRKNTLLPQFVAEQLAKIPGSGVFLLTDDAELKSAFEKSFGNRLVTTDCLRTASSKGLHYCSQESRRRLGTEVLMDMYLAARCDRFVGVGTSNVSAMIQHLREWPMGSFSLLSPSMHHRRNLFLHLWQPPRGFIETMAKHTARMNQPPA